MFFGPGIHSLLEYGYRGNGTLTIAAETVTLLEDLYAERLEIGTDGSLNTNGFRVFCSEYLKMTDNALIYNLGTQGVTASAGGGGGLGGGSFALLGNGFPGGNGANRSAPTTDASRGGGSDNAINTVLLPSLGGAGGAGGFGPTQAAGAGGLAQWDRGILGNPRQLSIALHGVAPGFKNLYVASFDNETNVPGTVQVWGGGGGGGGGSSDTTTRGGGGGGGGGVVYIAAPTITMEGTSIIDVSGGDGGDGFVGFATSGGGGGGGGVVIIHCDRLEMAGGGTQILVPGGAPGIGQGGQPDGIVGSDGRILIFSERNSEIYTASLAAGTFPTG